MEAQTYQHISSLILHVNLINLNDFDIMKIIVLNPTIVLNHLLDFVLIPNPPSLGIFRSINSICLASDDSRHVKIRCVLVTIIDCFNPRLSKPKSFNVF